MAFDAAGNLYVGGSFSLAGGREASGIARWDGIAWEPLGNGTFRFVDAIAAYGRR
jgi:hypothetical protein